MKSQHSIIAALLAPLAAVAHDGHGQHDTATSGLLHLLLDHGLIVLLVGAAIGAGLYALRVARRRR